MHRVVQIVKIISYDITKSRKTLLTLVKLHYRNKTKQKYIFDNGWLCKESILDPRVNLEQDLLG